MRDKKAPVEIGDVLAGKYEIERHLAAGGMGIVVVARHRQLEQQVAIKFMLPDLLRAGVEPDALERFVREGRAAVRLRGENIARVYDVDMLPDGMPYMVMEYLEGADLGRHVQKHGPLPLAESVDYLLQACVAMAEAHQAGIVHRDLKPSNLFLTRRPDGTPLIKVLDFGISKLFTDADGRSTQTAVVMGSPSFMAPEQAQSARNADVRSDIWSLGVILYECTSKQLPYEQQASTAAVLAQLIYATPRPLRQVAPTLPAAFCQVVDTCLQKDPAQRYQSVGELAAALSPYASATGRQAAASVHAIIGGASGAAMPEQAVRAPFVPASRPANSDDTEAELPQADTHLALAAPSAMLSASKPGPVPAADHGSAPSRRRGGVGEGLLELDTSAVADAQPLDLAIDVHNPEVRRELSPYQPQPVPTRTVSWRTWFEVNRLVDLGTAFTLAALTAMTLLFDGGPAWLAAVDDTIHRLGYQLSGWVGEHGRLLVGPALQVALPLTLAYVLTMLGGSLAASVSVWWLGQNLTHIARSVDDIYVRLSPITGDIHPWGYWLPVWGVEPYAGILSKLVYGVGVVLMVVVLVGVLRRIARQHGRRLR